MIGEPPWWYPVLIAADRLHCPAWDLMEGPDHRWFWEQAALLARNAENQKRGPDRMKAR
jgi:hypothetical protein